MDVVSKKFRVCLSGLAEWLYGCPHRRTSFPITLRAGAGADGRRSAQSETYIVCLACGHHFAYDWSTMRVNPQGLGWVHGRESGIAVTDVSHEQLL
jgi:hypothetical protein